MGDPNGPTAFRGNRDTGRPMGATTDDKITLWASMIHFRNTKKLNCKRNCPPHSTSSSYFRHRRLCTDRPLQDTALAELSAIPYDRRTEIVPFRLPSLIVCLRQLFVRHTCVSFRSRDVVIVDSVIMLSPGCCRIAVRITITTR
jgi:hypothetical protein